MKIQETNYGGDKKGERRIRREKCEKKEQRLEENERRGKKGLKLGNEVWIRRMEEKDEREVVGKGGN